MRVRMRFMFDQAVNLRSDVEGTHSNRDRSILPHPYPRLPADKVQFLVPYPSGRILRERVGQLFLIRYSERSCYSKRSRCPRFAPRSSALTWASQHSTICHSEERSDEESLSLPPPSKIVITTEARD